MKENNKEVAIHVVVVRFLNKNLKPLMMWYYSTFKKSEIYPCLKLFYDYKDIKDGINMGLAISILSKEDGWDTKRATLAIGYCVYCGYIS